MVEIQMITMPKIDSLSIQFLTQIFQENPAEDKLALCAFLQIIAQVGIRNFKITSLGYNDEEKKHDS
ncbi:MAG: hypothetical protein ACI37S_01330 [Candidatus Gastranaerophilaceae bacterium]